MWIRRSVCIYMARQWLHYLVFYLFIYEFIESQVQIRMRQRQVRWNRPTTDSDRIPCSRRWFVDERGSWLGATCRHWNSSCCRSHTLCPSAARLHHTDDRHIERVHYDVVDTPNSADTSSIGTFLSPLKNNTNTNSVKDSYTLFVLFCVVWLAIGMITLTVRPSVCLWRYLSLIVALRVGVLGGWKLYRSVLRRVFYIHFFRHFAVGCIV